MPQNYAGRLTLIAAVLLVCLFGVPYLADGIFSLKRTFDPSVPFGEKLNLKPGIDIAGGTSLLYEIKPPPGGFIGGQGTLADQVATILKKRVDPTGTRNLVWRPMGDRRLEIQLPRSSMTDPGGATAKKRYRDITQALQAFNVSPAHVIDIIENLKGDERATELGKLERGNEARKNLFAQLRSLHDRIKGLEAELAQAKKGTDEAKVTKVAEQLAQARIDYTDAKGRIEATNLQVGTVETLIGSSGENKAKELEAISTRFPERRALIAELNKIYPEYSRARGSIDDAADLKRLLRGSGVLQFHILVRDPQSEQPDMVQRLATEGPIVKTNDRSRWYEPARPEELGRNYPLFTDPSGKRYALAWTTPEKSMVHRAEGGRDWALQRAYPDQNQHGEWVVGFEFDDVGANLFRVLTGGNINQPLATILDGQIITAPNINSEIGKRGIIEGRYTQAELNYLISTLNAGALPAQLEDEPISEHAVGPQLGAANLRAGLYACVVGLIIAAAFLVVYYHLAGAIAIAGLLINFVIILGVSAMMGATFTLPGIAALVLTTGMAVDANVLIYERLREEQLRGLSLKMALRNAYDRAYTAILDSNITTAITSAFLIFYGSEEVKGFGLTLLVGILSSLFAALFVTKTIFAIMLDKFGLKKLGSLPLSFPKWNQFLHPKVDWMGKVPYFIAFSVIFVVLGLTAFVIQTNNRKMFDVEFQAGTKVQFTIKDGLNLSDKDVRELIEVKKDAIPQPMVTTSGESGNMFQVVTANFNRREVSDAIVDALGTRLDVAVPSEFDLLGKTAEEAAKAGAVIPVQLKDGRFAITYKGRTINIAEAPSYSGGAAIVLNNLKPELRPEEIYSRINHAMVADAGLLLEVVTLDPGRDPQKPTSAALVLVANRNFPYEKGEFDWREKLIVPVWKAINEGVARPASLAEVTNFDPQVAQTTQLDALLATVGSIVFIMIWIWLRFGDHKYGTATVFAMIHDTVMVVGAIGLSHWLALTGIGQALGVDAFRVNMTLVAAVLTVMSYSMVDTIVVFDRIRENRGKYGTISRQLINDSINQTLSRTLLTAGTTLMTLLVMYIWGGAAIHGFTFVLLIGIIIGTYSSIAVAAPILLIGAKEPAGQKKSSSGDDATPAAPSVGAVQKA